MKTGDKVQSILNSSVRGIVSGQSSRYIYVRLDSSGEIATFPDDGLIPIHSVSGKGKRKAGKTCKVVTDGNVDEHRDWFIGQFRSIRPKSPHDLWSKDYSDDKFRGFCRFLASLEAA